MFILGLPLKAALYFYRVFAASQDSDAVEALLPMPDAAIADVANVLFRKCLIGRLEFLQADDVGLRLRQPFQQARQAGLDPVRSEEHTSELQSLMRISYAVFCLKKKKKTPQLISSPAITTEIDIVHYR